jgi:hypothetical protein
VHPKARDALDSGSLLHAALFLDVPCAVPVSSNKTALVPRLLWLYLGSNAVVAPLVDPGAGLLFQGGKWVVVEPPQTRLDTMGG